MKRSNQANRRLEDILLLGIQAWLVKMEMDSPVKDATGQDRYDTQTELARIWREIKKLNKITTDEMKKLNKITTDDRIPVIKDDDIVRVLWINAGPSSPMKVSSISPTSTGHIEVILEPLEESDDE